MKKASEIVRSQKLSLFSLPATMNRIDANSCWVLVKNMQVIHFYQQHGSKLTSKFLIRMRK